MSDECREQAGKYTKLEDKVDKLTDIFGQIAISQELMQQELKTMNITLSKVDLLNLQLVQCSSTCGIKIIQLDREMNIHLDSCHDKHREFDKMFEKRDKVISSIVIGLILLVATTAIQHIIK